MLRPSFVPPADIRQLRDLTRYRIDLVGVGTARSAVTDAQRRTSEVGELSRACVRVWLGRVEFVWR
jgi:hypothetical protein